MNRRDWRQVASKLDLVAKIWLATGLFFLAEAAIRAFSPDRALRADPTRDLAFMLLWAAKAILAAFITWGVSWFIKRRVGSRNPDISAASD